MASMDGHGALLWSETPFNSRRIFAIDFIRRNHEKTGASNRML
jgi:hypothetical protein